MKSLFNKSDNAEMIRRIESVGAGSQALWGKMSAEQMLAHCQKPLEIALGRVKAKQALTGKLFGAFAKKKLMKDESLPKNLPTDKTFLISGSPEMDEEKAKLVALVKLFAENGPASIGNAVHPFFGKMATSEWDLLSWKHLDHHLKQFGA